MNLGQFIKQKRLEKNMTLEQLATAIGKNKTYVSRIENNKVKSLKDDVLLPLAEALGVSVMSFFDGFDENGNKIEKDILSLEEFMKDVTVSLNKTNDLNDEEKALILHTLNVLCSKKH